MPAPDTIHCTAPADTRAAGARLARRLVVPRAPAEGAALALLIGPLGAGKTVLAAGIAEALGVREPVTSPTYTIVSSYAAAGGPLHHVDLYRVEGAGQVEGLGLEDLLAGPGVVLVEWGERLAEALGDGFSPGPHLRVTLSVAADGGRDILVEERSR